MQTHTVLLRIVALSLLLYALTLFGKSLRELSLAEAELARCEAEYALAAEENARLSASLAAARNGESLEGLARERLGLVMPGEKIFYFTKSSADS